MDFLKWNEQKKLLLYKKINNNKKDFFFGSSCMFVKLNIREGLKIYSSQSARDFSWSMQKKASRRALAPKVGERFYFTSLMHNNESFYEFDEDPFVFHRYYGYITEIAKTFRCGSRKTDFFSESLKDRLYEVSIEHDDLHYKNIGLVDGRAVCIDFDSNSCRKI